MAARAIHALFVHGMGRSPASGWLLMRQLKRAGITTSSFAYNVSRQRFEQVVARLVDTLGAMPVEAELILIGHSLGGVLLRDALSAPALSALHIKRLFLLGSPILPSRAAHRLRDNLLFRGITRDCGHLLGSAKRMAAVGAPRVPTTGIAGTRGIVARRGPFGLEPNDGVVTVTEVSAPWLVDQVQVPVMHMWLPSSAAVARIILDAVRRSAV